MTSTNKSEKQTVDASQQTEDLDSEDEVPFQLNSRIKVYRGCPLSARSLVYRGERNVGIQTLPVAVKIVADDKQRRREAKNMAMLGDHANVVSLLETETLGDIVTRLCIVMESCQPISIEQYIANRKRDNIPFNPRQALDFTEQLAKGVEHIHNYDIIHMRLSPENVLLSKNGKSLVISSFGFSKKIDEGMCDVSASNQHGMDGYSAPEVKQNARITKACDIFSLGVIIYHIWSYGCHPFGEESSLWVRNIKDEIYVPTLGDLLIPDPEEAKCLLYDMLERKPGKRLNIDEVTNHSYIRQGFQLAIQRDTKKIWRGGVQDEKDFLRSRNVEVFKHEFCNIHINEEYKIWPITISEVYSSNIFLSRARGKPDGYLSFRTTFVKKLECELDTTKSSEINICQVAIIECERDGNKKFCIVRSQGYDDVVGIFIEDFEKFLDDHPLQEVFILNQAENVFGYDVASTTSYPASLAGSSAATRSSGADSLRFLESSQESSAPSASESISENPITEFIPFWCAQKN